MYHRVVVDEQKSKILVFRKTETQPEILFVTFDIKNGDMNSLSFRELARRLGEDILIDIPVIRKMYQL